MRAIFLLFVWLSLAASAISQNLVTYYPFNGNANDESGNNINPTYTGAGVSLTTDRFGNANKAYHFDGAAGSYIRVPADNFPTTDRTISFWFNADQLGYYVPTPFSYGGNVCNNSLLMIINHYNYTNSYLVEAHCGANAITAPYSTEPVNNWYQLTLTISGSTQKIFVNGVLLQSTNSFTSPTYVTGTSALLGACVNTDGITAWTGFFQGKLDDFRIYDAAMTDAQVSSLYATEVSVTMPNLLAYLPMNGNANDMSGNGFHGTVSGATLAIDKYNSNNSAYEFPADNSSITLTNSTGLHFNSSGFTFSSRIKFNSAGGVIIAKHYCWYVNGYVFAVVGNQLILYLANGGSWTSVTTAESFVNDKWYFVTAVYDGIGQAFIYVDGVLKASNSVAYNNLNTAPVMISGASNSCPPENYHGSIDEVKIYDSALDESQVMALYKESRGSGNALLFQGNALNQVTLPGPIMPPPAFTLEAWIKRNAVQQWQWIFSGNINSTWQWGLNGNTMLFGKINGGGTVVSNTINIDDNKWHHVAVTYDGTSGATSFFVDGTAAGSGSVSSSGIVAGTYSIGNRSGTTESFDGYVDEFRIWGIALDNDAIRNWMCRKITADHPNYNDLGYYYNFDEPSVYCSYDVRNGQKALLADGPVFINSGAPIGDASAIDFTNPIKSPTISLANGEAFNATATSGSPDGIIVYEVKDFPNTLTGSAGVGGNDHYFGVYVSGGSSPQYTATYDYTGNGLVTPAIEPSLQLYKRNDNSAPAWTNSAATLNTAANTLTVTGQNTEYILGSLWFPLPVTSLNLQARKTNTTTAQLNWRTVTEINNKGFEVQRSFDGNYYTDVQFVNGAGIANDTRDYSITDVPGRTGRVYYRLKQIDLDGNSKLSNIVSVLFDKQGIIKVYPNPAQIQVTVEGLENYSRLQVLDATGKLQKDIYTNGQYQVSIDLNGLKSGIYLLRMINEKGSQTVKLIISN